MGGWEIFMGEECESDVQGPCMPHHCSGILCGLLWRSGVCLISTGGVGEGGHVMVRPNIAQSNSQGYNRLHSALDFFNVLCCSWLHCLTCAGWVGNCTEMRRVASKLCWAC